MRYRMKVDRWLAVLLLAGAAVSLGATGADFVRGGNRWLAPLVWMVWAVALGSMLPQHYELRPDGLFIRQGWRRKLIPYAALVELRPVTDGRSAAVLSLDRVQVTTRGYGDWLIAPAAQRAFLDQLAGLAPHLERRGFGLAVLSGRSA